MRHRMKGRQLARSTPKRRALFRSQIAGLFVEGRIITTVFKAKEVRRLAEKLITRAKKGTLHDRRLVISKIPHKQAVAKLFGEIAPRFQHRPGGYTRIVKLGFRRGDAAPMAAIELVE